MFPRSQDNVTSISGHRGWKPLQQSLNVKCMGLNSPEKLERYTSACLYNRLSLVQLNVFRLTCWVWSQARFLYPFVTVFLSLSLSFFTHKYLFRRLNLLWLHSAVSFSITKKGCTITHTLAILYCDVEPDTCYLHLPAGKRNKQPWQDAIVAIFHREGQKNVLISDGKILHKFQEVRPYESLHNMLGLPLVCSLLFCCSSNFTKSVRDTFAVFYSKVWDTFRFWKSRDCCLLHLSSQLQDLAESLKEAIISTFNSAPECWVICVKQPPRGTLPSSR